MKRSRDEFDSDNLDPSSPFNTPDTDSGPVKIVHLGQEAPAQVEALRCSLPGHDELSFSSYEEYESHYNQSHLWKCSVCGRNFPSEHYLGLHIEENHDSLAKVRMERGEKIYACFVPDCPKKCQAPYKRQMHLRYGHGFPEDYDFNMIRTGIGGRNSLLKSGRTKHQNQNLQNNKSAAGGKSNAKPDKTQNENRKRETNDNLNEKTTKMSSEPSADKLLDPTEPNAGLIKKEKEIGPVKPDSAEKVDAYKSAASPAKPLTSAQPDTEMEDITSAMSSLRFVPPSIRFGHGRGRGRGGLSRY